MNTNPAILSDLVTFARIEQTSGDLEPWAEVLRVLDVEAETRAWLVKLYNAYDDFGSAWAVYRRWPSPADWRDAEDWHEAADYPCTQERRGLRGGRILRHLESYVRALEDGPQNGWLLRNLHRDNPMADWDRLVWQMREVWGVGRQTAFEWAEFAEKSLAVPVRAPNAALWESEGPRRSLERIWGDGSRITPRWLEDRAVETRTVLDAAGVHLSWEDFETVICDFNVMRDGRYYPGRHLAALRAEIDAQGDRDRLLAAWYQVIPEPWCDIVPGVRGERLADYRDTGLIADRP